jgi:S-adenosylmethionine:tRNA ribosyltransferase-isomerase
MVALSPIPEPFRLQSYFYDIPEDRIAQHPTQQREASRLLLVPSGASTFAESQFSQLPEILPPGSLLVHNNSKVLPARLLGTKPTGGKTEFLLLTPLPLITPQPWGSGWQAEAEGLVRGLKAGQSMDFHGLTVEVIQRGDFGRCQVRLAWYGDLADIFVRHGHIPLPPYITRTDTPEDADRYQTIYANPAKLGSVAAPTAGLHFTPAVLHALEQAGIRTAAVTLYVGYGTFSPVRSPDIRQHRMHAEYIEVDEATASAIARTKKEGRPVVAVGTTSARALESLPHCAHGIRPYQGWTDLYILPGYQFQVVDALITNFHLPGSSLLIMVAALAGLSTVHAAYAHAIHNGFRFYSYGDAMLVARPGFFSGGSYALSRRVP